MTLDEHYVSSLANLKAFPEIPVFSGTRADISQMLWLTSFGVITAGYLTGQNNNILLNYTQSFRLF